MENVKQFSDDHEIKAIAKSGDDILESSTAIEVVSPDTQKEAIDCLGLIKINTKKIEERRKYFTQPMNQIIGEINATAKRIAGPFNDAKKIMDKKLINYQDQLEAEKRKMEIKAQKKIEKAIENDKPIPVVPVISVDNKIETGTTKSHFRDNYKGEVVSKIEAIKGFVEKEMWEMIEINQPALNRLAKIIKNSKVISGIRIFNDKGINTRV